MAGEERLVGTVDDPGNVSAGEALPQRVKDRQSMDDIAQRAGFDQRNPPSLDFGKWRANSSKHRRFLSPRELDCDGAAMHASAWASEGCYCLTFVNRAVTSASIRAAAAYGATWAGCDLEHHDAEERAQNAGQR